MQRPLKYLLILCLQFANANGQQLPFKTFTTKDGLISNQVTAVMRDNRGLLWIGTPFGINWFDGFRFTEPQIKKNTGQLYVTNFFKDSRDNIWILTFYNGLYKYEQHGFANFLPATSIESNSNNIFDMVEIEPDRFVVATDQNLYWFDGKNFSLFDKDRQELFIQFNSIGFSGDYLFFGESHGIVIYKKINGYWSYAGKSLQDYSINHILTEGGHTWVATNKGLHFFEDPADIIRGKPSKTFFAPHFVLSAKKNPNTGELWISADRLYQLKAGQWRSLDPSNGLPAIPGKMYFDKENIAWFCSSIGLTKLTSENYLFYDLRKGPSHSMITVIEKDEKNDLWIGTYDGIAHKVGNEVVAVKKLKNKSLGYTAWMHKTKQNLLLAGTNRGIILIKNNQLTERYNIVTTKVYEDDAGVLWAGTLNGTIYKITNDTLETISPYTALEDFIDAIYKDDKGFLWIGYRGNGICKYEVIDNKLKLIKQFSAATGYNDLRIRCSYTDEQGNILFGTRTNGIFIISHNGEKTWHYNAGDGLAANWVKFISSDKQGSIYLVTNKGVNILFGSYDQPFIRKINFGEEFEDQVTTLFADGEKIWIGSESGFIEYFPVAAKKQTRPPEIFLTEVSINGKTDTAVPPYTTSAHKKLTSGNTVISFEFAGVLFSDESPLQYRYKLEGQDNDWIYSGGRNFVTYNLRAGNYVFKAEARNAFGEWSKSAAVYSFNIPAPFWKTWWFVSGILLLGIILFFFIYRYRVQQALKLERLRSRISTDLHDDIGSTLSSISILSEIAAREKDFHQSENMMQEIKQSSVSLMEKMDDIVWSINPSNDSIEMLMLRIKRFASKLFEAKEIDYEIDIDESIGNAKLNMETRQHIYLIMKEAINNLVKYSGCTRARIHVLFNHNYLQIEISDNGKGFNQQKIQLGNGIISMKKRAESIKADIKITTEPGKGTLVALQTKIK